MKTLSIPYGNETRAIQLPQENWGELLAPQAVRPIAFEEGLRQALGNPTDGFSLAEFLKGSRSLLILVNDDTRPTPSARVLEFLRPHLDEIPFKIMVATGTHPKRSDEGCRRIFGPLWPEVKEKVLFHDCRQEGGMVYLGQTSRGTRVLINPAVMMADRLLVIGSVEPHYFAGYTGGRKAIIPGVAAYSSIVANHSLAMDLNSRPLQMAGNPVHEDLEEALQLLTVPPIFSLMLVLTPEHHLFAAYSGSLQETMVLAAQRADEVFTVPFDDKADILLSTALPPMDIDLYQSQKPIEHGKMALKENGILILVMPCPNGPGPPEFQELFIQAGDREKARALLAQPYRLGLHRITRNVKFLESGGQIWGVTDLDPAFLSRTFIQPISSLQTALDLALAQKGPAAKVHVLLNASLCVPKAMKLLL